MKALENHEFPELRTSFALFFVCKSSRNELYCRNPKTVKYGTGNT